jgi:Tol biopolymer transport system component
VALIGALAVAALVPALGAGGSTPTVKRVNVSSAGAEANGFSFNPSVSADGRFVAFDSEASSLVAGDLNGASDVFVHDRRTGRTRRVSVRSTGAEGNDESFSPSVSADGRFVAFDSDASTLVAGDLNGAGDVFVHDRRTGRTTRVSLNSAGAGGNGESINPSISAGGRFVAFQSSASNLVAGDDNGFSDVFVRDRRTGRTRRMSLRSSGAEGNNGSVDPSVSADGRFVAFQSLASNLVAGDANDVGDVFVRDRRMGRTSRVSVSSAGAEGDNGSVDPSISADGRLVAFVSDASNLVAGDGNGILDVFVRGPLR